jgi:hypothetical protein
MSILIILPSVMAVFLRGAADHPRHDRDGSQPQGSGGCCSPSAGLAGILAAYANAQWKLNHG